MKASGIADKSNRKAQLQMSETVFVVFIILIIILLGFVAYSKYQEGSIKEQQKELRDLEVIKLSHQLGMWPELECSEAGLAEFTCLDVTKLAVLSDFINRTSRANTYAFNYYHDQLGQSQVTITEIYPSFTKTRGKDYWELWNNPGSKKTTDVVRVPVSLYDPFSKNYALGIMTLQVYD